MQYPDWLMKAKESKKLLQWIQDPVHSFKMFRGPVSYTHLDVYKRQTVHIGDYSTVEELDKAISDAVKNGQLTQEEADSVQQ